MSDTNFNHELMNASLRRGDNGADMELNQVEFDEFIEIGSIAAGNAATSLSAVLGRKVNITVPNIAFEAPAKVPDAFGGADRIATVVHFSVSGQISGSLLLILSLSESLTLASILT